MAKIRAFKALRPAADKAAQVACVPYDVVDKAQLRVFVEENPLSFLRVTRPRYEFERGERPSWDDIFAKAKANLEWFVSEKLLTLDDREAVYVYRLRSDGHSQTGVVACCSLDEYEAGLIKKHEHVRPDKVEERAGHILTLRAQTGLIFLTYRSVVDTAELIARAIDDKPIYEFFGADGVEHTVWRVAGGEEFVSAFDKVPSIYIADGHHRIEAARRVRQTLRRSNTEHTGSEDYNFVMAGLFPAEEVRILPYNRVVRDLSGMSADEFLMAVGERFLVRQSEEQVPKHRGEICMYFKGQWFMLTSANKPVETDPISDLDVSVLQNQLLGPILGITDPRIDDRLVFVGGKRSVNDIERAVDAGSAALGFSLYPPTVEDMLVVSDMGETMPPKSTWFEPKLKDGVLVHLI